MKPYYEHAGITLYHGDCREILPGLGRFDLLLTDPPYGIGAANMTMGRGNSDKAKKDRFLKSNWDDTRPVLPSCESFRHACIWGGNYFADVLAPTNHWLIWHKMNDGRSFSEAEMAWTTFKKQTRVFQWSWLHNDENKQHPTQKPVPLMQWCLSFAKDAETILDPFCGSGTTLVAAKLEGRKAIGIEINERYCEIAASRLAQGVLF